jgi:mRNA interferase MazF
VNPRQGEIWWATAADKRRPVLVVTRSTAADLLNRLVCAPVTSTVRGVPTEIALGKPNGLSQRSAASFDNLQLVSRTMLTERIGRIDEPRRRICAALAALADC